MLTTLLVEPKFTNWLTDCGVAPFTPGPHIRDVNSFCAAGRSRQCCPEGSGKLIPRFLASSAIKGKNEEHRVSFGGTLSEELDSEPANDEGATGPIDAVE
jgi:hypothetical protein